jgi:hypothetical protein
MVHTQPLADKGVGVPGHSCERREIARRRAEAGWRAAVLDERATVSEAGSS